MEYLYKVIAWLHAMVVSSMLNFSSPITSFQKLTIFNTNIICVILSMPVICSKSFINVSL